MNGIEKIETLLGSIVEELARIRAVMEREEHKKKMVLQKVNDENSYTKLR